MSVDVRVKTYLASAWQGFVLLQALLDSVIVASKVEKEDSKYQKGEKGLETTNSSKESIALVFAICMICVHYT